MNYFKIYHKNLLFIFITLLASFTLLVQIYIDKNYVEKMNFYKNNIQENFQNNLFTMTKTTVEEKPEYTIVLEKNTITLYNNSSFNINKSEMQIKMTVYHKDNEFIWICEKYYKMLPKVSC